MDVNYLDGIYVQMGDGSFKTSNACGLGNLILAKPCNFCKGSYCSNCQRESWRIGKAKIYVHSFPKVGISYCKS